MTTIGLRRGTVQVVPYTEWPQLFQEEKTRLKVALGNAVYDIEHVGSTLVPGPKRSTKKSSKSSKQKGRKEFIIGCTEIMLLIQQDDTDLPVFNTTRIHAETAVERALPG